MIFITKKKFEEEVCSRVEKELCRMEENRYRNNEIGELHNRCGHLERRLEKLEGLHQIPTNMKPAW